MYISCIDPTYSYAILLVVVLLLTLLTFKILMTPQFYIQVHDYQEYHSIKSMRKMKDCRLVDELALPLKNFENFLEAATHASNCGLSQYLSHFLCPQPGDWPAQFYMRQIQYNLPPNSSSCLRNIVPFIGPLHIQLNARECVCLLNIEFFKKAYSAIFGERKYLSNKPKAWRISFLEEVLYGGWTLIRDQVYVAFSKCKDLHYLTLLNLLDNYLPLSLSIYSVIFKSGNTEQYITSVMRCWVMFFCFKRHHYNKAPLVWLSNLLYWKKLNHPLFHTIMNHLNIFDEYPVENFHSLLRAQTRPKDTSEQLHRKARAIDNSKAILLEFQSIFSAPKNYTFSRSQLQELKLSAAKFLCRTLKSIKDAPNSARQTQRPRGKGKNATYWILPILYGENIVSSKILPLGFQFSNKEPILNRYALKQ